MYTEIHRGRWLPSLALLALLFGGCAHAPRPVPVNDQVVATAEMAGVTLSVPRLDYVAYPRSVLSAATPVLVIIDNQSDSTIVISRGDFTFGVQGGMRYNPVSPRQILVLNTPPVTTVPPGSTGVLLAGPVQEVPAPSPAPADRTPPPAPGVHEGSFYGPHWHPGLEWGAGWGPYGYSGPYAWDPYYWGPTYYPHPRRSIIRAALQQGQLQKGGRAAGFIYFPRLEAAQGTQVTLSWQVHTPQGQVVGNLEVPLEFDRQP